MYNPSDILTIAQLSAYLRTTEIQLLAVLNGGKLIYDWQNPIHFKIENQKEIFSIYQKFYIPKRNKKLGYRIVYKIKDQCTLDILKVLKFNLNEIYNPIECVHGFVRNRNTRSNALMHLGKKFLLKLDIENFFESIDINQVKNGFISLGFNEEIANALSKITTLEGRLVPGFPTSPMIANFVCANLDIELNTICIENNYVYSRYADDLSVSSNLEHPCQKQIKNVIESHNFKIKDSKTQRFKRGQNQYVTGLSISDIQYPRIPKAIKRRLRQKLYYLGMHGYHSHICFINDWDDKTDFSITRPLAIQLSNRIKGWIDYIHSIEPEKAKIFYLAFNQIEKVEYEIRLNNALDIDQLKELLDSNKESIKPIPKIK